MFKVIRQRVSKFSRLPLAVVLICLPAGAPAADRPTIAVLTFQNATGDTNLDHWAATVPILIQMELADAKSVRIPNDSSADYAYKKLDLISDKLTADQARSVGEVIEARWVVWGSYARERENWKLTAQVMNVGTGKASPPLTAASPDMFQASLNISDAILHELDVTPTEKEKQMMGRPLTTSARCLELLSRAMAAIKERKPLAEQEKSCRDAVSADPECSMAQATLAYILLMEKKFHDGELTAKLAVKAHPDSGHSHFVLGMAYLAQGSKLLARDEFTEALQLAPDFGACYSQLGEISSSQGNRADAVSDFKKAINLEPYTPRYHVALAREYRNMGDRDQSLRELEIAESCDTDFVFTKMYIGAAYAGLNETPKAAEYFEEYVNQAKAAGLPAEDIEYGEKNLAQLKSRLTPSFITATEPRRFTPDELRNALQTRLSGFEVLLVINPLASSPEMKKWAEQLAGDARDEQEKAKRLFDGLTRHIDLGIGTGKRSAAQTFKDWSDPKAVFICQDYALLYVALAREIGLKAYFVLVAKDPDDRSVSHACASVFIDGKALLIDPAYHWFGIPHHEYKIKDDLQLVGLYTSESRGIIGTRIGIKLDPDDPYPRFYLVSDLAQMGKLKEAREALDDALKLDSKSWMALANQGLMDEYEKNWNDAAEHLQQCLAMRPYAPHFSLRYRLGMALNHQGKLAEAREQYRAYLRDVTDDSFVAEARRAISQINETLKDSK